MFYYFFIIFISIIIIYFDIFNFIFNNHIKRLIINCNSAKNNCIKKCTNTCSLIYLCFTLFYNTIFILFMQKINKFNINMIDNNIYSVQFVIGSKIYKIFIKHNREPSNILQIIDQSDQDVTNELTPIFNVESITPTLSDFGFSELTIMDSMGDDHILTKNDKLTI